MKRFLVCVLCLLCLMLPSCGNDLLDENTANDYIDATAYQDSGRRVNFEATVVSVGTYSLTVTRNSDGLCVVVSVTSSDPITDVDGSDITIADIGEGDTVKIIYDGSMIMSDPAKVSRCYGVSVITKAETSEVTE